MKYFYRNLLDNEKEYKEISCEELAKEFQALSAGGMWGMEVIEIADVQLNAIYFDKNYYEC